MKENSNVLLFETKTPAWVLTLEIFQSAAVFSGHQRGLSWSKYERGARAFKWWHAEDLRYGSCKTKVKHWLKEKGLEEKETGSFRGRFHDMIMKHYQAAWWLQISLNKLGLIAWLREAGLTMFWKACGSLLLTNMQQQRAAQICSEHICAARCIFVLVENREKCSFQVDWKHPGLLAIVVEVVHFNVMSSGICDVLTM